MKKLFVIIVLMALAMSANAQDVYSVGYYNVNNGTIAALYKNNERLYTAHITGLTSKAARVACNSQGDVFWLVCHYNYPSNTLNRIEIRKNNQVYASTVGHDEIHISDMYMLNDTLYYTGYQLDENGITTATVWKGEDFATHWILGDGIQASVIYDADVDKNTNIPYFCGYVSDTLQKACVWKASQLLYKQEPSGVQRDSKANEISIDNGEIYTKGFLSYDYDYGTISIPTIWKDNEQIYSASAMDIVGCLYAHNGDYYYTLFYPHGMFYAVYKNRETILQLPIDQTGVQRIIGDLNDIYMVGSLQGQGSIWKNFEVYAQPNNCSYICDMVVAHHFIEDNSEWYYEILNDDSSITYQHLKAEGDTTIHEKRPKIIIRSNTQYDRDEITEVTHEYIYEEDGIVYWWNKDLEEFTILYDLNADVGDEWEIKVGLESLTMHVDAVDYYEYEGTTYRMLRVSDPDDYFSGEIVCGIGHLTSFFPERLMNQGKGYRVVGLRCYWIGDELVYHDGNEDCDAIYAELHNGINEDGPSTGSGTFMVYPNPTDGVLTVSVRLPQCDSPTTGQTEYQISNLMGQTLLQGRISAENQQLDISNLPAGMYFISVGEQTVKFVVK